MDTIVNYRIINTLANSMRLKKQDHLLDKDLRVQEICRGMHEVGMWVDVARRRELAIQTKHDIINYLAEVQKSSGIPDFNPNSAGQLRKLLFETWGLAPVEYTKLGDPKTDDFTLRMLRAEHGHNLQIATFIFALRKYKKAVKVYGTYIQRMVPYGHDVGPVEIDDDDRDENEQDPEDPRGLIMPDGRIRPDYNSTGTKTGRLSSSNPNCFTGDTEILTELGWIRFDQLPRGLKVAQYYLDGTITFVLPTAYIEEDFDGDLVHNHNQHIDLLTTPDHRCLVRNRKTGAHKVFLAKDYPSDWQQLHAGQYAGGPGIDISDDLLRFIIAAQADGSWVKGTTHNRLDFGFNKVRKIEEMDKLIQRLGVQVVVRTIGTTSAGGKRWGLEGSAVDTVLEYIGHGKHFGPWLLQLNRRQMDLVLEEIWNWDGCFTRKNHYSSNEKVNVDWMQALMALTGSRSHSREYQAKKSINHQVDITRRDYSLTTNCDRELVPYKGKVYCVSVPASYIVVRRGGEAMITGQSQNFPKKLRSMVRAAPGHVLVGADADHLELRIITAVAQIKAYLEVFQDPKGDPHAMTASLMFGEAFTKLVRKSEQWTNLRKLGKGIAYASFYGSGDETVHSVVTSAEEDGKPVYPNLTVREVALMRRKWLGNIPEMKKWWDRTVDEYRDNGYLVDPVWGRRRDFLDGEKFNELINFGIQSAGAHIVHDATFKLIDQIPFFKWGPGTGLINQCHDALVFEVPMDHEKYKGEDAEFKWCPPNCKCTANKIARMIKEAMNVELKELPGVKFSATPEIDMTWDKV